MPELPMADERAECCETCRFWEPKDRARLALDGECRRAPPTAFFGMKRWLKSSDDHDSREFVESHFPQTYSDDWCGEWKPKNDAAPA